MFTPTIDAVSLMIRTLPVVLSLLFGLTSCSTDEPVGADASVTAADLGADSAQAVTDSGSGTDVAALDQGATVDMATADVSTPDMATTADMADQGAPDMAVDMPQVSIGETCETATEATAGGTFTGDTTGGVDDYSASLSGANCPSGAVSGPDHVYRLAPTADTTYNIVVEPEATFDPFLYLKSDCAAADCVDGTVLNGPGTMESLTVTVPAGSTYFLIVDGELLSEGAYTLTITAS